MKSLAKLSRSHGFEGFKLAVKVRQIAKPSSLGN
ncbi:Uncharacterised protein [Vibrio cholerae]|nr:Uncharacterised protein [Vibrio cholerae]